MANRYRARTHGRATEMKGFIGVFRVPYSRLRRIHGPSKLRLEVTESEPATGTVDFTPIRTHPCMRVCLETQENKLFRYSRGELKAFVRRMRGGDPRAKAIPLEKDGTFWEGLFGECKPVVVKLSEEEKKLERRGCLWNGKIVGVVDDELFPGWGEDWALEDVSVNGSAEDPSGSESASTASDDAAAIDAYPFIAALGTKRPREDDDQEDGAETAAKKPRIA